MNRVRGTGRGSKRGSYAGNSYCHDARSRDRRRGASGRDTDESTADRRGHRRAGGCRSQSCSARAVSWRCSRWLVADGVVQAGAIALAAVFAAYAMEKDRHLRRLALLRGDSQRITLAVADELMFSGALAGDRELLDLRDGIARSAGQACRRSRRGRRGRLHAAACCSDPSGEVPVAAERELNARRLVPDDPAARARSAAYPQVGASRHRRRPGCARGLAPARRRGPSPARGGRSERRALSAPPMSREADALRTRRGCRPRPARVAQSSVAARG